MILVILPVILFAIGFVLVSAGVIYGSSCSGREEKVCEGEGRNGHPNEHGPRCSE